MSRKEKALHHIIFVGTMLLVFSTGLTAALLAQRPRPVRITLDGSAPRVDVSPTLYGIFLEEINHAGEGGIYAEMVQNRDFEVNTLPAGAQWAGNLIKTKNNWYERKGFGNNLWGWRLEEDGSAVGQISQVADHPLNPENPVRCGSMYFTQREAKSKIYQRRTTLGATFS